MRIFNRSCPIVQTKLDDNQARFGVTNGKSGYKIFFYFLEKDCKSIAVGSYCIYNGTYMHEIPPGGDLIINTEKLFEDAIKYRSHKTSFHPTGKIVTKDKDGKRYNEDEKDSQTIAFGEIKDALRISIFYPMVFTDNYKKFNVNEVMNIVDTNKNDFIPMIAEVYIARFDFDFCKKVFDVRGNKALIFEDKITLLKDKLNIYVVFRKSNNKVIPKKHIHGMPKQYPEIDSK